MNKILLSLLAIILIVIILRRRSSHVPGVGRVTWTDQKERDRFREELEREFDDPD